MECNICVCVGVGVVIVIASQNIVKYTSIKNKHKTIISDNGKCLKAV